MDTHQRRHKPSKKDVVAECVEKRFPDFPLWGFLGSLTLITKMLRHACRDKKVTKRDWLHHEMRVLIHAIYLGSYDQVNLTAGDEVLVRRVLALCEACDRGLDQPN